MFYTDINLTNPLGNIYQFKKKKTVLTAIVKIGISTFLFKGNSTSESNLILMYFSSQSFKF